VYPASSRSISLENAPINTEVFYKIHGTNHIIHLVNFTGDRRMAGPQRVQDAIEVHGLRVRLRVPARPQRVVSALENTSMAFEWQDSSLTFEAPPFAAHGVWLIEA